LFRPNNVGKSKSECAVAAAKIFNPELNATGIKNRVAPETEKVFNCAFWNGLDFAVNAVDNVKARLFVDA
jgi:ubiquitin-activating enzyme E1